MSPRRSRGWRGALAVPILTAASVAGVPAPAAAQGASGGQKYGILDLELTVLDLELSIESLDGSLTDTQTGTKVELTLAADVLFAFDKDTLNVASAVSLAGLAERIGTEASGQVRIAGYADSVGDSTYNLDLSKRRATTV
jgi:OmpA-OmpF porin, OOP family